VLLAATLVGVVLALAGTGDDGGGPSARTAGTGSSTTRAEVSSTEATTTTAPLPTFGKIKVLDIGSSSYENEIDRARHSSYAIVIENTGDQVARRFGVDATLLDAGGNELARDHNAVYVLMPGQKFAVGHDGFPDGVMSIRMSITEPALWEDPAQYGAITTSGIGTTLDAWHRPVVAFTATSPYDRPLDSTYGFVVFRNAAGKIVGAQREVLDQLAPGGDTALEVDASDSIADVDATKTEVYVDPAIF
jgi:hypothetical protein